MKRKLCVFTLYSEKGASSQYRAFIFKNELDKRFDTRWYSFWTDKYATCYMHNKKKYFFFIALNYLISTIKRMYQLVFIAPQCDIVFIQKAVIPKLNFLFLKRLKKKKIRIVFDVDDAIYTLPRDNSKYIADISDCVICGNQQLKKYYSHFNKNCIIVPTIDNTHKYAKYWNNTFNNKIIGWIGSQTTLDNFDLIIDALNEIVSRHPEVKIAIVSNTALDYTKKINNSYLVCWSPDTYLYKMSKFTVGIMPLKDNKMNRGKCGFKLIQYLNMKKPVIGSGVGVNKDIIANNGIVANTKKEWVNAFEKLLYDKAEYQRCVRCIEDDFFKKYHYDIILKRIISILDK